MASAFPVSSNVSWLKSTRRAISVARVLATDASRLATKATVMKARKPTQSCGSLMLNVPMGGRKKKSRQSAAATDVTMATQSSEEAATKSTRSRYDTAAVVSLTM